MSCRAVPKANPAVRDLAARGVREFLAGSILERVA